MWFELLNSISCAVMLVIMLPLACIADPRRHPFLTLVMVCVEITFGLQVLDPWLRITAQMRQTDFAHPQYIIWYTAILHAGMAFGVIGMRARIWAFVRAELARQQLSIARRISDRISLKRASDWHPKRH